MGIVGILYGDGARLEYLGLGTLGTNQSYSKRQVPRNSLERRVELLSKQLGSRSPMAFRKAKYIYIYIYIYIYVFTIIELQRFRRKRHSRINSFSELHRYLTKISLDIESAEV